MMQPVKMIRIDLPSESRSSPGRVRRQMFFVDGGLAGGGKWGPWWEGFFRALLTFSEGRGTSINPQTGGTIERRLLDPVQRRTLVELVLGASQENLDGNTNLAHAARVLPANDLPVEVLFFRDRPDRSSD